MAHDMTGRDRLALPERYVNDSGQSLSTREFWALVDQCRQSGRPMRATRDAGMGLSGAWLDPDGTWWRPDSMTGAELAAAQARHERDTWWQAHQRDISVIPALSDQDLILFRLLADIRADVPAVNAAAAELWQRGIRDYPIAI
jgi:hypothetical protein